MTNDYCAFAYYIFDFYRCFQQLAERPVPCFSLVDDVLCINHSAFPGRLAGFTGAALRQGGNERLDRR